MSEPLSTLALRLPLRVLRAALTLTRELTERGLDAVDLIADVLSSVEPEPEGAEVRDVRDGPRREPPAAAVPEPPGPDPADIVIVDYDAPEPVAPEHLPDDAEIVEEVAEPGAQDGAGAQVTIDEPFAGYDTLRAADVVARLRGADAATLAAIELYELGHRKRRTVLDAIAREARRPRGQ